MRNGLLSSPIFIPKNVKKNRWIKIFEGEIAKDKWEKLKEIYVWIAQDYAFTWFSGYNHQAIGENFKCQEGGEKEANHEREDTWEGG